MIAWLGFFFQPRPPCLIIFRVAVYSQISTSDENDEPMIMIIMAWVHFEAAIGLFIKFIKFIQKFYDDPN